MRRSNCKLVVLALLLALFQAFSGCRKPSAGVDHTNGGANANGAGHAAPQQSTGITPADQGDFKLKYLPRKHPGKHGQDHRVGENEPAIAGIVADLNQKVALPFDITLSVSDCDEPDAY